jgi:Fe-S-cluster containining protein
MATATASKPARSSLPAEANLCDYCTAKCCRYFALPVEAPKTRQDFDYLRWYLLHDHATLFLEDGDWYLLVHTTCKHLRDDHLCGIYETRPQICREYATKDCEYEDEWTYDHYFETPEQIHEYAEAVLPVGRNQSIRSPKPASLPIVG